MAPGGARRGAGDQESRGAADQGRQTAAGKFARLAEICEEIAARQEKALVFTQFREMTDAKLLQLVALDVDKARV